MTCSLEKFRLNSTKTTLRSSFWRLCGGGKRVWMSSFPWQKTVRTGKRLPKVRLMTMATKMAPLMFMMPAWSSCWPENSTPYSSATACANHLVRPSFNFGNNLGLVPDLPGSIISTLDGSVPEFIDPVFGKTSPKQPFSVIKNELFGLYFRENWIYRFGHRSGSSFCMRKRTK